MKLDVYVLFGVTEHVGMTLIYVHKMCIQLHCIDKLQF